MHAGVRSLSQCKTSLTYNVVGRKPRVVQVQSTVHPASQAGAVSPPWWAQGLLSAALSASLLMSPVMMPPATSATGMEGNMLRMKAPEGTAAAEFSCTPLSPKERVSFLDLGGFTSKIHTSSPEAQALFDQGLLLMYDFNRPEAVISFEAGLQFDPDAAMLHWGLSHARGPFINKVWGPAPADGSFMAFTPEEQAQAQQDAQAGLAAARRALQAAPSDPQLITELSFLEAEAELWGSVPGPVGYDDPRAIKALETYAQRMEVIAAADITNPEPLALAADAHMNMSPWIHWQGPLGHREAVYPDTVVYPALDDIAEALRRYPGHPLASHLKVHLTEGGTPGKGLPAEPGNAALGESAADSLAFGHPYTSMGHLMHMPGHLYIRLGRWHDAVTTNQAALRADEAGIKRCVQPYEPEHNSQMLLYAAMNTGQLELAEQYADASVRFPATYGPMNMADGRERVSKPLIQARFAKWAPIMQLQQSELDYSNDGIMMLPPTADDFGRGVYHYVRSLAFASAAAHEAGDAARQLDLQMTQELQLLARVVDAIPDDVITRPGEGIGVYSPGHKHLAQIGLLVARSRADVLHGDLPAAAAKLREAIHLDQAMGYMEPPRQYQPVRECLGWVLLQQGQLQQAEQEYLRDLAELPENPWALKGLDQVYAAQGPTAAERLEQVQGRLAAAWAYADPGLTLNSSCHTFSD